MFNIFGTNRTIHPIGIDLGSDSLKMVQLARQGEGLVLVAAARAEIPAQVRSNRSVRQKWLIETITELMTVKPFKGRSVSLALPANEVFVDHLRLSGTAGQIADKVHQAALHRLPFAPDQGVLRHLTVGEVYFENETRKEVILMALPKRSLDYYMGILGKCRLDADKLHLESHGLISGFAPLVGPSSLAESAYFIIDLGFSGSRIIGLHGEQLCFLRSIPIGAEKIAQAVQMDTRTADKADAPRTDDVSLCEGSVTTLAPPVPVTRKAHLKAVYQQLRDEIQHCVWYHDTLFPYLPLESLIFTGGLARQTQICQALARSLNMHAQLADSINQVEPDSLIGPHSDIETLSGNYEWSLAFGLSLNQLPQLSNEPEN